MTNWCQFLQESCDFDGTGYGHALPVSWLFPRTYWPIQTNAISWNKQKTTTKNRYKKSIQSI